MFCIFRSLTFRLLNYRAVTQVATVESKGSGFQRASFDLQHAYRPLTRYAVYHTAPSQMCTVVQDLGAFPLY
jgi:hypothetical protein